MEELYHVEKDDSIIGPVKRDYAHLKGMLHCTGKPAMIIHPRFLEPQQGNMPSHMRSFLMRKAEQLWAYVRLILEREAKALQAQAKKYEGSIVLIGVGSVW